MARRHGEWQSGRTIAIRHSRSQHRASRRRREPLPSPRGRPLAIAPWGPTYDRLRPRRDAGRHRARSRRHPQRRVCPRGPAAGAVRDRAQPDRRRRPPHDRARPRGRKAAPAAPTRSSACSATSSRTIRRTSPTARGRFPALEAALDTLGGGRRALCGVHQQARRAVGAAPGSARPRATASPPSAARTRSACRSPTPRSCGRPSGAPAASPQAAVMVGDSGNDIDTARAAGVPVVAVDFGYTEVPVARLGPDRVISDFAELPAAVRASSAAPRCRAPPSASRTNPRDATARLFPVDREPVVLIYFRCHPILPLRVPQESALTIRNNVDCARSGTLVLS